jgi:hypothetical protein
MADIDEILYVNEHIRYQPEIGESQLSVARNKIKHLNMIAVTDVWYVINKQDQNFYNYCRSNKLPYGKPYPQQRVTIMSHEQYLLFALSGINHNAKFYKEVSNLQLTKWALAK